MKAQTSIEFILFISMIFLITLLLISATAYYMQEYTKERELNVIIKEADMIKNEVYLAATVEEGYTRTFEIRPEADEPDFNLTQQNNTIILKSLHHEYTTDLGVNIAGTLKKGNNTIRNNGGNVSVN